MADNTIVQSGYFTSAGVDKVLELRSDIDWMQITNFTEAIATTQDHGVRYYWQRGMTSGRGLVEYHAAASSALSLKEIVAGAGFYLLDTTSNPVGALNSTITAVSNAAIPIVSATSTSGVTSGCIVRLINITGAQQLGGLDFTVDTVVANTSFRLPYMAQIVAGTAGYFRVIANDPIFYPRKRSITKITAASSAVVTMSVTHGYIVGEKVRFSVPDAYGMVEMNGLTGTITAIDTTLNTITVDIDSSAFTAFAFPLTAIAPFTPAEVFPFGEAAESSYANLLDDATLNSGYIGMKLKTGVLSPAGSTSDVIYWVAGKTFNN